MRGVTGIPPRGGEDFAVHAVCVSLPVPSHPGVPVFNGEV